MQKRGREWADALHVHTGRTARWACMHKAKHHLKRGVVDNGCPANGDDKVFETQASQEQALPQDGLSGWPG